MLVEGNEVVTRNKDLPPALVRDFHSVVHLHALALGLDVFEERGRQVPHPKAGVDHDDELANDPPSAPLHERQRERKKHEGRSKGWKPLCSTGGEDVLTELG